VPPPPWLAAPQVAEEPVVRKPREVAPDVLRLAEELDVRKSLQAVPAAKLREERSDATGVSQRSWVVG
jgi:hypothetical protein